MNKIEIIRVHNKKTYSAGQVFVSRSNNAAMLVEMLPNTVGLINLADGTAASDCTLVEDACKVTESELFNINSYFFHEWELASINFTITVTSQD